MSGYIVGVGGERSRIVDVSAEYRTAGFSHREDDHSTCACWQDFDDRGPAPSRVRLSVR
jgi:hypothetical protein